MAVRRHTQAPQFHDDKRIEVELDRTDEVNRNLKELTHIVILVGIPSDAEQEKHLDEKGMEAKAPNSPRDKEPGQDEAPEITNATLGYIHERGSPINNVPARPWLGPGVANSQDRWLPYIKRAAQLALEGSESGMMQAFHAAGMTATSAVKVGIVNKIPPPLSQVTIDARAKRVPSRTATGADDVTPLVDTAQMLNSISYVVKR